MDVIGTFDEARPYVAAKIAPEMEHQLQVSNSVDRVIHISLSEAEWQAFLKTTPKPVDWLRERIREAIEKSQSPNTKSQVPTA
jgi:hypothetical protein